MFGFFKKKTRKFANEDGNAGVAEPPKSRSPMALALGHTLGAIKASEAEPEAQTPVTLPMVQLRAHRLLAEEQARLSGDRRTRRICVFDTNALLNNPHSIFEFGSADIYIPRRVRDELDNPKFKNDPRLGYMARKVRDLFRLLYEQPHPDVKGAYQSIRKTNTASRPAVYFPSEYSKFKMAGFEPGGHGGDDDIALCALELMQERDDVQLVTGDKFFDMRVESLIERCFIQPKDKLVFSKGAPNQWNDRDANGQELVDVETEYLVRMFETNGNSPDLAARVFQELMISAQTGNPYAQKMVGWMYFLGEGVESSREEALLWITKAAHQGDSQAIDALSLLAKYGPNDVPAE